ncbi:hypothetical protein IK3_05610 [Bacillus toyonensis]|uniref:hypothetical protein n=1 Tax=Bacillus toyonensis TaxID=155322 RepID=UPI000279D819|nr:hypothetical protein [Bacillus toyonensis]EJR55516.1 hypothetical protein IK3_05610 [Bacillus toyonensis]
MLEFLLSIIRDLKKTDILNLLISICSLIITFIIGWWSIRVAKSSLIYSQRSSLIKESYDPILEDIKLNRNVSIHSSNKLNFERFHAVKNSYIYYAFDDELIKLSESIFISEQTINKLKNKMNAISSRAITNVLNKELKRKESSLRVYDVDVENKPSIQLYEFLISGQITQLLILNEHNALYCDVKEEYTYTQDEMEFVGFKNEYRYPFLLFLDTFLNLKITDVLSGNEVISDVEYLEKQMINELKNHPDYKSLEVEYIQFHKYLDEMEMEIVHRIKELIIPGYKRPKNYFLKRFLK